MHDAVSLDATGDIELDGDRQASGVDDRSLPGPTQCTAKRATANDQKDGIR